MNDTTKPGIVGNNGKCPVCGAVGGTVVLRADGRYRNICYQRGCPSYCIASPRKGYDTMEEVQADG